ncbi:MAG: uroporphyrinogen decarboxylase [Pirellulales bacterium]
MNIQQPSFQSLRVASLESRRSEDMQRLIERFGGQAFVSPSMREVPIPENRDAVDFAYRVMTGEINIVLFLTGVGFKHLLTSIEKHVDLQRFLNALSDVTTVARGPKPVAAMRDFGLQPTYRVQEPNTWREMLHLIDEQIPVTNQIVGIQEYGATNRSLVAGLEARGAQVVSLRVYQWELPQDSRPLEQNMRAIIRGERDLLMVTSAHQIVNLLRLAEGMRCEAELRTALEKMLICSIGPTTSEMIQHLQLQVDIEPENPKMGHLVQTAAEKANRMLSAKRLPLHISVSQRSASNETANTPHPSQNSHFMRACRRQPSSVTPIWLMRQAGRYMAEYRAVREKVGFLELCKNPALCAEVMVTAVTKLGVDAAIIFSDLLPILEPMGMDLEFAAGDGPVIHNPIRTGQDIDRIHALESMEPLQFVADTVTMTRRALPDHIPVIGFSGSPFTLASYMIEGGGSRNYAFTKTLMYSDEGAWRVLMSKLASSISLYLNEQILAGAQCVQLFDSWAGCMAPTDYERYVLPYMNQILESIIPNVPVINFSTGNPMLTTMLRGDRRTVVGLDWRIGLDVGWDMAGNDRAVQGNLDPLVLLGDRATIRREVKRVLQEAQGRAGHIFNLGHGILPQTPVENAIALVDMVHELSAR